MNNQQIVRQIDGAISEIRKMCDARTRAGKAVALLPFRSSPEPWSQWRKLFMRTSLPYMVKTDKARAFSCDEDGSDLTEPLPPGSVCVLNREYKPLGVPCYDPFVRYSQYPCVAKLTGQLPPPESPTGEGFWPLYDDMCSPWESLGDWLRYEVRLCYLLDQLGAPDVAERCAALSADYVSDLEQDVYLRCWRSTRWLDCEQACATVLRRAEFRHRWPGLGRWKPHYERAFERVVVDAEDTELDDNLERKIEGGRTLLRGSRLPAA